MRRGDPVGQMGAVCGLLALWALASPAQAREVLGATSDAPTIARQQRLTLGSLAPPGQDHCLACSLRAGPLEGDAPGSRAAPSLAAFDLALRLDQHPFPSGRERSPAPAAGLRLSLVPPASPSPFTSLASQGLDSLSLYVLEVPELSVVASARQQGRGGLWAELAAGAAIVAHLTGLESSTGFNATPAGWFGTHLVEVRSARAHFPRGPPAVFAFVSQENGLTRNAREFQAISLRPGGGLGLQWKTPRGIALTLTSGANAGPLIDLRSGAASPGFSLNFHTLSAQL